MQQRDKIRVLIIEDDVKLANLIKDFLESHHMEVLMETRGDTGLTRILADDPDLLILDLMLPVLDGMSICRQARRHWTKPILMLTARGKETDEVEGLEAGADDYLAKPVKPRVLLARINALLRRVPPAQQFQPGGQHLHRFDSLEVDSHTRTVRYQGRLIDLTTGEFDLLLYMVKNPGCVLDRDELYRQVRGIEWDGVDRSIDVRVVGLRQKLGDDAKNPSLIKSIRGTGYLLAVKR